MFYLTQHLTNIKNKAANALKNIQSADLTLRALCGNNI